MVVLDAARTPEAHAALVALARYPELVPPADPERGCPDIKGSAVDVMLLDLKKGNTPLRMGSSYMEMAPISKRVSEMLDTEQIQNRAILASVMTTAGFEEGPAWWDYFDPAWGGEPDITEADYEHALSTQALEALERAENPPAEAPESEGGESVPDEAGSS